jgi:hypothetical protein
MKTKTSALTALRAAGFNAQLNAAGLRVWGDNWEAQFTDLGQDHDTFAGDVPAQVHELAVWDDPFARMAEPNASAIARRFARVDGDFGHQIEVGLSFIDGLAVEVSGSGCFRSNARTYASEAEMLYYFDHHQSVHFPHVLRDLS